MPSVSHPKRPLQRHFLKEWRDFRSLGQEEAASLLDLSRTQLSKIENRKSPYGQQTLEAAAKAYACSVADILMHNPRPNQNEHGGMTLADFLAQNALSPSEFAAQIGVPPSTITRLLKAERLPGLLLIRKINDATKGAVTADSFLPKEQCEEASSTKLYLREWRQHRGLTQEKLAEMAGVTQGLISHLENGRTDYSGNVLIALADALGCEPADLLARDPFDKTSIWSIADIIKTASPAQHAIIAAVVEAILKTIP